MPLPFLTADREPGAPAAAAAPLPHPESDHWRRPYRPGPWRVGGGALLLLLASYLLFSAMIIGLAGALPSAGVVAGVGLLVIAFALRLLRAGVWVSPHGLRHAGLFRTTTLPWSEVGAVRTTQSPVKWLGLPRTVQGEALTLARGRGEAQESAPRVLLTDHNADFLSRREAFDRAADVIEAWAADSRP
ncbi:PH domain-containing protein [Streptomyces sp. NPDC048172]|uniref:PH domain-containing protein n=1 Tax=Streptomyces sp. NPDC048172 TaxID=3365505 RepID=UPI00371908C9